MAESLGVDGFKKLNKQELVYTILDHQALSEKKKTGSNGADKLDLPDEVPMSSDNMRMDKRQPGAIPKRGRKPAHKEADVVSDADNEDEVQLEETSENTVSAESTPVERPQQPRRPEHKDRNPQGPRTSYPTSAKGAESPPMFLENHVLLISQESQESLV